MARNPNSAAAADRPAIPGQPAVDPAAWRGADLADSDEWIRHFSGDEIADLAAMAADMRARIGDDPNRLLGLPASDFPLGRAASAVADTRRQLRDGLGFILLRGLPVAAWDRLTAAIVYWALGRHLGTPLANNPQGDMIGHVVDLGKDLDHPQHRGYQTNATMFYHVDQCDVVGLMCLRKSKSGGASKVSSSITAHNVLWQRQPAMAEALTETLCWSRMGEVGPGQNDWYEAPLFDYAGGRLSVAAGFKHVEKGHDLKQTPPLPDVTRRAMLALNDIAEEFHLAMDFEPGDIQLLNSYVTLHTRTGFVDWPEPARRRHLWRIWLNVDGLRPRSAYARNWENGVWAPADARNITLDAF